MGSYNQTCAVTHLPIRQGDPVALFVIGRVEPRRPGSFEGYTSSGSEWQAVSLPFFGTYEDEGTVDVDAGASAFADPTLVGTTAIPMSRMLESAAEGGDPSPPGTVLRQMMVHRGMYDRLSASLGGKVTLAAEADRVLAYADAMRAAWAKRHERSVAKGLLGEYGPLNEIGAWSDYTGRPWTETPYAAHFFDGPEGISPRLRRAVVALMEAQAVSGDREATRALLCEAVAMRIFDANLQLLRRTWAPQSGLGDFDEDHGLHRGVAEWTAAHCRSAEAGPDAGLDEVPAPGF